MTKREWLVERASAAHRSGNPVRETNLLMAVYRETMKENDIIRKEIINSVVNISCKGGLS